MDKPSESKCLDYGLQEPPSRVDHLHEAKIRDNFQYINKDELGLLVFLPGIDKQELKVRSNEEQVVISTQSRADLREIFRCDCSIDLRINLIAKVDPESTIANYRDGILELKFGII